MTPVSAHSTRLVSKEQSQSTPHSQVYGGRKFSTDAMRVKNYGLASAFTLWASENAATLDAALSAETAIPVEALEVAEGAGVQDKASQFFIDLNLQKLRNPAAGYLVNTTENEIKSRLQVLSRHKILQDDDFRQNWSFFALTEARGGESKSQIRMQWLKNGKLQACTLDAWSQPPFYVALFEDGKKETFTGFDALITSLFGIAQMKLDRIEKYLNAYERVVAKEGSDDDEDDMAQDYRERMPEYFHYDLSDIEIAEENVNDDDDDETLLEREEVSVIVVQITPPVEQSYMTLRSGKRVYYRPEIVKLRRYFPPAHKLPLKCR